MKKQLFIAMALLSLGVTSCKDDVTFDQDTYDNLIKEAFPVKNVDPTHQWTTVGVANTSIAINTGTGDTYQVKIYDENPIGYKGTLKLYGEGRVADGNTLDMKIRTLRHRLQGVQRLCLRHGRRAYHQPEIPRF